MPVSNDQSCEEISGRRASQRLLRTEYVDHDANAPKPHSKPAARVATSPLAVSADKASTPTRPTPNRHSAIGGSKALSFNAPSSRGPVTLTTTRNKPMISEVEA